MGRASGACHVAEITRTHGGRRYRSSLLRRTYRQDGQVKHEPLGNLSRLPAATIALIRRAVRGDALVSPDDAFEVIRSRPHGHVAAVVGTARKLGLPALLAATRRRERDLVEALMAARLLDPCSKLATARALGAETEESSLGESRERFGIARGVLVGDRGMLTDARLREDLRPIEGLDWITALRAPAIQALAAGGALQLSLFDQQDLAEITHPDYPGERLVVCKNPLLAEERSRKRGELLAATERELATIAAATQ